MKIQTYLPYYKKNIIIAIPIMLTQVGQVIVQQVDCMMIGRIGTNELAAASLANSIYIVGLLFIMGFSLGLTPMVGQNIHNRNKISKLLKNSILSNTIICLSMMLIMYTISFGMHLMNQPIEIVNLAIPYYRILVLSSFPFVIFLCFKQFAEGIGNTIVAMIITLSANIINIILNYFLIFGTYGFPKLGIEGAGYATFISRILMAIIFLIVFILSKKFRIFFFLARKSKLCINEIKRLINIGLPISSQMLVEVSAFSVSGIMMGWISTSSLAAHQIALGLATLSFMIASGISSAATIRVSHHYNKKNYDDIKKASKASIHMVLVIMTLSALSFILFRHQLPLLYSNDLEVIKISASLLILVSIFQIFDGIQLIIIGILRGMADVNHASIYSFISFILISIPASYVLAFELKLNENGVWIGLIFGLISAAAMYFYRLQKILIKH